MRADKECFRFNFGTFNVRGLSCEIKQNQLVEDFDRYKLDILCVQETKIKNGGDWTIRGHRVLLYETECRHYGNGFIIHKNLEPKVLRTWKISDRLCVLQISLDYGNAQNKGKVKSLTIINLYAPTSALTKNNPDELDKFYNDLQTLIDSLPNNTIIIFAGDFNSKVGKRSGEEICLGNYSRGFRNENGENLVDFCEKNKLFITNTAFNKAARHITTWVGSRKNNENKTVYVYNQIDYIICRQGQKHLITNAQSYGGTKV
ncbi:craniofacial development protein 2-like [Plakobranchus ocellatus]|uniref:Craniofacial development protein 2-like n=1 Tax=Plakobranchus ocellatus TaxID=259542 RepID=A0AAV4C5M7_9GAST|nr:craniofacial development protein 2-like [Plakobranchus ocellatus]